MSRNKVLVVEDERSIAEAVCFSLRQDGFEPVWVETGEAANKQILAKRPDLVILDIGLPDVSGWDLGRTLIAEGFPVIFLTSRSMEADRVAGLEMGGEDYVVKPFSPRELVARVRVVLRRTCEAKSNREIPVRGLSMQRDAGRAFFDGRDLELTRNEFRLLEALAARPGRVFSRERLLDLAWDDNGVSQYRTVDAHIKQLRSKFRQAGCAFDPIETRRGFGYALREFR